MSIGDLLLFAIPEETRIMTAEERAVYFPKAQEENVGIRSEEQHTILAIACKKRPLFIGRAAPLEACLKKTEKNISKKMPAYENLGCGSRTVDGKEIRTFAFRYTVQGQKQVGEYGLCFAGRAFLAFEYICREDCSEFAVRKYEELLSSVKFKA